MLKKWNWLTMDKLMNVKLTIGKVTYSTTEDPGLRIKIWCVKPGLWAQPSHSLCLEYLWHIY